MDLSLEPDWRKLQTNDVVNVLVQPIILDNVKQKHLVQTAVHKRFVVVYGTLTDAVAYSLLGVIVSEVVGGPRLQVNDQLTICHQSPGFDTMNSVIEACAGIGCMGSGLVSCGMTIRASNELREPLCKFQERQGRDYMVPGDVCDPATWKRLHEKCSEPALLSAGFSCQPWSRLGDGRMTDDDRSNSLKGVLQAAFFLRSFAVMLECVVEAGRDTKVQATLDAFCRITGFQKQCVDLRLETLMPATRRRWWCVLVSPIFPKVNLRPLPSLLKPPAIGDLFPVLPCWPAAHLEQLYLDRYETRKFEECGGILRNVIDMNAPLKTALHGWANQLMACPCSCRQFAMSDDRLRKKGLFGALVLLDGYFATSGGDLPCTRHLHPCEIAAAHGVHPDVDWTPLRLGIAALGQMASPVQSCWVAAQFRHQSLAVFDESSLAPEQVLHQHLQQVFRSVVQIHPVVASSDRFVQFVTSIDQCLGASLATFTMPKQVIDSLEAPEPVVPNDLPSSPNHARVTDAGAIAPPEPPVHRECGLLPFRLPSNEIVQSPPVLGLDSFHAARNVRESGPLPFRLPCQVAHKTNLESTLPEYPCPTAGDADPLGEDIDGCNAIVAATAPVSDDEEETACLPPKDEPIETLPCVQYQADPTNGGLPGFRSPDCKPEAAAITSGETEPGELTQALQRHFAEASDVDIDVPTDVAQPVCPIATHIIEIFRPEDIYPQAFRVNAACSIGEIAVAEAKILSLKAPIAQLSVVGTPLLARHPTTPMQRIHLREMASYGTIDPKLLGLPIELLSVHKCRRIELLYHQEAWVAEDEMTHYLTMLRATGQTDMCPPCIIPPHYLDEEVCSILDEWYLQCERLCAKSMQVATAILVANHWFPVMFRGNAFQLKVLATPDGKEWIHAASATRSAKPNICCFPDFSVFRNDCGFQCVGWLTSKALFDKQDSENVTFDADTATTWRMLFEHHLVTTKEGQREVTPCHLQFGGANGVDLRGQLIQLLIDHGVPQVNASSRSDTVLEKLGRSAIANAMRSKNPWRDIKALANQATPKLQLVLASEMQSAIEARLKEDKPFGARKQKKVVRDRQAVNLQPEDIHVPEGIFKEGDQIPLAQIGVPQINQTARGVVVVQSQQAMPYLKMSKPVSNSGLALLVLDHGAAIMQGVGNLTRFPAQCTQTGEPILLTAKLVQIGSVEVSRNSPAQIPKVDEVATAVVKVLIFKDEVGQEWDELKRRPVKWLVQQFPFLASTSDDKGIVDCWDRQHMTSKLERTKPELADIIAFNLRLAQVEVETVLSKSGHGPVYFEPRTEDGRSHLEAYRVVWLPKSDKPSALLAVQSTGTWACLVRSGPRYGVRVHVANAAHVHQLHRPHQPYLDASKLQTYIVGPFPYGANKQSLSKIFSVWTWPARPVQPKGRAADNSCVLWEVQAAAPPQFNVYQLEHADVLVTQVEKKTRGVPEAKVDVQGSAKTLAALTKVVEQNSGRDDPWLGRPDPWANYHHPAKVAKVTPDPQVIMQTVAGQMEQRLMRVIEQRIPSDGADSTMISEEDDARIADLESRLTRLESQVTANHEAQEKNHQAMANQVNHLHQQVESQGGQLQQHFDQRMQEQLSQIERLLMANRPNKEWLSQRTSRSERLTLCSGRKSKPCCEVQVERRSKGVTHSSVWPRSFITMVVFMLQFASVGAVELSCPNPGVSVSSGGISTWIDPFLFEGPEISAQVPVTEIPRCFDPGVAVQCLCCFAVIAGSLGHLLHILLCFHKHPWDNAKVRAAPMDQPWSPIPRFSGWLHPSRVMLRMLGISWLLLPFLGQTDFVHTLTWCSREYRPLPFRLPAFSSRESGPLPFRLPGIFADVECSSWQTCARVGEAAHPGPVLGTFNACGIMNRSGIIAQLPEGMWGVTETHLTHQAFRNFNSNLRCRKPDSSRVPLLSHSLLVLEALEVRAQVLASLHIIQFVLCLVPSKKISGNLPGFRLLHPLSKVSG